MINIVIIEKEIQMAKKLSLLIENIEINSRVLSTINSTADARSYFEKHSGNVDLVFWDICLYDQNTSELVTAGLNYLPIIFVTECEFNIADVLKSMSISIGYIVKPITEEKVKEALLKYSQLKKSFSSNGLSQSHSNGQNKNVKKTFKTRLLVKKSGFYEYIRVEDIACIFVERKIIFLLDLNNTKYITSIKNLSVLENELDSKMFFRANRKFIVNIHSIKKFKPLDKVKLEVKLNVPFEEIIISQVMAPKFKAWINEELVN